MPSPLAADVDAEVQLGPDGQVQLPLAVRRALSLRANDRLRFRIALDGTVTLARAGPGAAVAPSAKGDGIPQALGLLAGALMGQGGSGGERLKNVDPGLVRDLRDIVGSAMAPPKPSKPPDDPGT